MYKIIACILTCITFNIVMIVYTIQAIKLELLEHKLYLLEQETRRLKNERDIV